MSDVEGEKIKPLSVCPRCQERGTKAGATLCEPCQAEEIAEAQAGEEDAQVVRDARQHLVASPAAPPGEDAAGIGCLTHAAARLFNAPANGTQQKAPPASAAKAKPSTGEAVAQARTDARKAPPPAAGKRMSLGNVKAGVEEMPYRLMLYGVGGIGKSTFGAESPMPIFIPAETSPNIDCPKFPQPETFEDVIDAVKELGTATHEYKTLVIDTADKLEPLAWDQVIQQENERNRKGRARNIEDVGGGYGKGYAAALVPWRRLLQYLERLQDKRRMNVLFIAHSRVRMFKNPEGEDYDRWEMKLDQRLAQLLHEWVDADLFTNYRTTVLRDKRGRSLRKGESDGGRLIYTQRAAAYDAKNRYGLPAELSLSWSDFDAAVTANRNPEALTQFITEKLAQIAEPTIATWVAAELEKKPNVARLVKINNKLAARLEEMARAAEEREESA